MPAPAVRGAAPVPWPVRLREAVRANPSALGVFAFIVLLHAVGWLTLLAIVSPQQLTIGSRVVGLGIGFAAYALGLRHAFDADHIAAIDNTTRRLMDGGKPPLFVGFWFSLGHSSVVFVLALILALGVRAVSAPVLDESSELHQITGLIGATVSSGFLYLIAALNIVVFIDLLRRCRRDRAEHSSETPFRRQLSGGGIVTRLLGPAMGWISRPWHMYVVGLLFGLGFDTATEIALLVLTGSGAASGLPWYAVMCLPTLFAAGMSLMDTADGVLMYFAYGWASPSAARKVYYNLVVTGLSIAAALVIALVQTLGLLSDRFELSGPFWAWVAGIELNSVGFAVVALFMATWLLGMAIWHYGRRSAARRVRGEARGDEVPCE